MKELLSNLPGLLTNLGPTMLSIVILMILTAWLVAKEKKSTRETIEIYIGIVKSAVFWLIRLAYLQAIIELVKSVLKFFRK